jgi:hypothetical protein
VPRDIAVLLERRRRTRRPPGTGLEWLPASVRRPSGSRPTARAETTGRRHSHASPSGSAAGRTASSSWGVVVTDRRLYWRRVGESFTSMLLHAGTDERGRERVDETPSPELPGPSDANFTVPLSALRRIELREGSLLRRASLTLAWADDPRPDPVSGTPEATGPGTGSGTRTGPRPSGRCTTRRGATRRSGWPSHWPGTSGSPASTTASSRAVGRSDRRGFGGDPRFDGGTALTYD